MKSFWHLLFYISLILSISGCSGDGNIADQSFLTQKPCKPPCWYGLELDKSSGQEVLDVLNDLPFIKPNSINDYEAPYTNGINSRYINYACVYKVDDYWCGTLLIENGKLILIDYALGYELNIKTAIDIYGPPNFVQYQTPMTEKGGCALYFYWLEYDMRISFYDNKNSKPCDQIIVNGKVDPDINVKYIEFSTQNLLSHYLEGSTVISWPGYIEKK